MVKVTTTIQDALKEEMASDSWPELRLDCCKFALSRMSSMKWKGVKGVDGGVPPGGHTVEDIFDIVVCKTLDGSLNCGKNVPCVAFLKKSIMSVLSNLAKLSENKITSPESAFTSKLDTKESFFNWVHTDAQDQEEIYSEFTEEYIEKLLPTLLDFFRNDEVLFKITKIFLYAGAVFPECFHYYAYDAKALISELQKNGYIGVEGNVLGTFWYLKEPSDLDLSVSFADYAGDIYSIIALSPGIKKPQDIAKWLRLDVKIVYNKRKQMNRRLRKFIKIYMGGNTNG
ncbi:MAG: hypothetical protein KC618_02490 [Candidatus Omnitrophica bacterium]|nr:hypothetical protein [Candidatus Omnitrophota bacterium]